MKVIRERSLLGVSKRVVLAPSELITLQRAQEICDRLGDDYEVYAAKSAAERLDALLADRLEISFTEQHL